MGKSTYPSYLPLLDLPRTGAGKSGAQGVRSGGNLVSRAKKASAEIIFGRHLYPSARPTDRPDIDCWNIDDVYKCCSAPSPSPPDSPRPSVSRRRYDRSSSAIAEHHTFPRRAIGQERAQREVSAVGAVLSWRHVQAQLQWGESSAYERRGAWRSPGTRPRSWCATASPVPGVAAVAADGGRLPRQRDRVRDVHPGPRGAVALQVQVSRD